MSDVTPKALAGVRVLDLSRILAGPWATQLLGDLGADVIKVERPGRGDDTRHWGPPFLKDENGAETDAAYFLSANRNKRSVAIDFSKPDGAALIRRMATDADIVVENFKLGGLKKVSLDYESLAEINPRLVYCSITGFGQTGPYAERAGYDYMIQAMGGLMSVTGQPDGAPGAEPMKVGVAVADLFAGMYASNAILAALRHAERTGEGQHIDISLFDCQIAMLANQATNYLVSGVSPGRLGNAHPNIAPYQVFEASDGYLVLAVGNDDQFVRAVDILGLDATVAHETRFATNRARVSNRQALANVMAPAFKKKSAEAWLDAFEAEGVPAGPINTVRAALEDQHTQERGLTVPLERDDADGASITKSPLRLSRTPTQSDLPPPKLGADTAEVLSDYLESDDIAELRASGVVG